MKKMLFILLLVPIICIAEEYDANITGTGHWIGDYYHYNANATIRERGYKPAFVLPFEAYEKAAYGSRLPETVGKGINNFFKGYETGLSIKQLKLENQLLEEQLKELQDKRRARELKLEQQLRDGKETQNHSRFDPEKFQRYKDASYINSLDYESKKGYLLAISTPYWEYWLEVFIEWYPEEYKKYEQNAIIEFKLSALFGVLGICDEIILDNPYTVDEFAQKIKSEYPQYNKLSNIELTERITTKYGRLKKLVDFPMTK